MRLFAICALAGGCTLVVQNELDQCPDLIFLDGTPNNGGQHFSSGVSAPSFRGPAFPRAGEDIGAYGSTLTFLSNGTVVQVGGQAGDQVFLRAQNATATFATSTPGHNGPGGFGCAEVFAASYDSLRDRTTLQLLASGCGNDEAYDGGTIVGAPEPEWPVLAWAPAPDGGGVIAAALFSQAQSCPESFPLSCFPPQGGSLSGGGPARRMDALLDARGEPVWIVSTDLNDTRLYNADFTASTMAVAWAGPIAALASDVGIVMRINAGELDAQLFDSTGAPRGPEAHTALNDPGAHGLEISRLGTAPVLRLAWIGGDGKARAAQYDASNAGAQLLGAIATVCGSSGTSFAAPTSTTTVAVVVGSALHLRRVE